MRKYQGDWLVVLSSLFVGAAIAMAQSNPISVAQAATLQIQTGNFQTARKLLLEGLRSQPNSAELWNLLGITDSELKDVPAAQHSFEHGLSLAPQSISLNENVGLLFYKQANYAKARTYLLHAVELGSRNPGVRFSLAAARMRTGERTQALVDLKSLEPLLGDRTEYWEERGRAEFVEDASAAESSFNRALNLTPNSLTALNGAALAAEKQGLLEKALAYLIKARAAAPDDIPTLEHFGALCIRSDLGQDAYDALTKAHQLDPSNSSVLYLLARANISLQNWQQAYNLFSQVAKRNPRFAPAYYAMGWVDIRLNQLDDAHKQLEHCLSLQPNMEGAIYELAQLEINDHAATAETLLRTALRYQPHDAKASTALGDIEVRKGKLNEAEILFESAIRDDPKFAAAHYKLGLLLFRKHEVEKGKQEQAIAANLNADANQASKVQLRLVLPDTLR